MMIKAVKITPILNRASVDDDELLRAFCGAEELIIEDLQLTSSVALIWDFSDIPITDIG